jgi:hypothetical protein
MDEGAGVGEGGAPGRAEVRLCNLVAQSPRNAKGGLQEEVEKDLTGKEEEQSELIYFKVYNSQIPVIEQAIETAARMLGSDKSRGYCLEMICSDFLAGANLDAQNPEALRYSMTRFFRFLPGEQQHIPRKSAWEGVVKHSRPRKGRLNCLQKRTANSIARFSDETAGDVRHVLHEETRSPSSPVSKSLRRR